MNKSHLLGSVCAFTFAVLANTAHAAVVNPILSLNIGGTLYDVTFHDSIGDPFDSFNVLWDADDDGVFGGGSSSFNTAPTFWGNPTGAQAAATTIIAALGTSDTTTTISDSFFVPYSTSKSQNTPITSGFDDIYSWTDNELTAATDVIAVGGIDDSEGDIADLFPYATFAPVVPIPATVWLFDSGLLGLVGMARCKKA